MQKFYFTFDVDRQSNFKSLFRIILLYTRIKHLSTTHKPTSLIDPFNIQSRSDRFIFFFVPFHFHSSIRSSSSSSLLLFIVLFKIFIYSLNLRSLSQIATANVILWHFSYIASRVIEISLASWHSFWGRLQWCDGDIYYSLCYSYKIKY